MRRGVLLAGVLLATSLGHAAAADMALSVPPPIVPPSWSGLYVGAHAGAAWQSLPNWSFVDPNQFPATFASATLPAGNTGLAPVGGFQGGYN